MKRTNNEGRSNQDWRTNRIADARRAVRPRSSFVVLIAMIVCATGATSFAQALIGTP